MICEGKSKAYRQMVLDAKFKNMIETLTNASEITEQPESRGYTKKYIGYRLTKGDKDLGTHKTLKDVEIYLNSTYQKVKCLAYKSSGELYSQGYRLERVKNPNPKKKVSKGVVILKDGEYITECASVTEAANYLNTRPQNVSQNLRGKSNTVMGYVCVRYSDYYEEE